MSEQNLLNYNLFKTNDNNNLSYSFEFPMSTFADQRRVITSTTTNNALRNYTAFDHSFINQTSSPYYLPPITTTNSTVTTHQMNSILNQTQKLVMDRSEQWDKHVSQSAIIIKEKTPNYNYDSTNIDSTLEEQAPTHIVSPEAIREALKEEKEEELGHSESRPFSKYSSFHALKQRRLSSDVLSVSPPQPSLSIPFSPPPTYEDEEEESEEEEPESPFPAHHHHTVDRRISLDPIKPSNQQQEKLKRPPNAYLLFNRDMRRKLLKQSPKMTVAEISKEVGDWWKALPHNEREYYVKEASILKEEHLKKYPDFIYTRRSKAELAEAKKFSKLGRKSKPSEIMHSDHEEDNVINNNKAEKSIDLVVEKETTIQTNPKKRSRKSSTANGGQRDPRGRKKKRHKHPFAPKHPMSAYLYYLASVYPQVSLNFPGSTVGPISKSISKTWHAMTPEERLPWKQKAESDKARYAREMQVYMAKNNQEEQSKLEELKLQQQQLFNQQQQQQQQQINEQQLHQLLSSDEEVTSLKDEEEDFNVHTIAAVVHMVNHGGSLMYHSP